MTAPTPTVASADLALATANARLDDVAAARREAEQAFAAARKARQTILDNLAAGTGHATTPSDLEAADTAMTTASRQHEIAVALETSGQRAVEQAAIDRLHAEAGEIEAATRTAYARVREAAAATDAGLTGARNALTELKRQASDLIAVHNRWRWFTEAVTDAARSNTILASLRPDQRPRAAAVALPPMELQHVAIEPTTVIAFGEASILNKSLAQVVSGPIPPA